VTSPKAVFQLWYGAPSVDNKLPTVGTTMAAKSLTSVQPPPHFFALFRMQVAASMPNRQYIVGYENMCLCVPSQQGWIVPKTAWHNHHLANLWTRQGYRDRWDTCEVSERIYIYIYIYRERERERERVLVGQATPKRPSGRPKHR
jgi:hypothetical protein